MMDRNTTITAIPARRLDRQIPWAKLGTLDVPPQTAAEAMSLAGLDYTVSKVQAGWTRDGQVWSKAGKRVAIVRDDTNEFFEFVSPQYEVFQYTEAFDFMDAISPKFVAAGGLKSGRQAFLVVEPEQGELTVGGDDKHRSYAVLRTSHDRSRAIEVSLVMIRYRCTNQLTISALGRGENLRQHWSVPHLHNSRDKLLQAQQIMVQLDQYTSQFQRLAERLMRSRPEEKTAREILAKHVARRAKGQEEVLDTILYSWHEDTERVGFNDTAWGLVQSVSEWFDWGRPQGTPESRFLGALQGVTHTTIDKVTHDLLALAA